MPSIVQEDFAYIYNNPAQSITGPCSTPTATTVPIPEVTQKPPNPIGMALSPQEFIQFTGSFST